ncbi:glycoside hydrolase family 19 protein [Ewingella americana]|uniref:glycoside hydrolase family 19 protein n=1 Tax=Ewingella americana TaxID=41202 RepID=UPI001F4F5B06|nr:hypothetical protein [Ewingella americana]
MPAKLPKFSYPVPSNKNGQAFSSALDLLSTLGGESSGQYLVGSQGMWHGGIHITDTTIPWCALSTDSEAEKAYYNGVPYKGEQFIRCMADGEIVAFRVCKDYESEAIEWRDEKLQLSSSFVLVKHYIQPGDTENSELTFYTLYMNLAPFAAYSQQGGELNRKTAGSQRYYASADDTQASSAKGSLEKDTRVTLSDNIITRTSDRRQFTEITLTAETKNAAGATLAAGTKIWTVSDQGSLKAASPVPVPPWWAKCTPAYGTQHAGVVNCTARTDWSFYLSREDVLQRKAAGKLTAGFPLTYEPGHAAQQVIRPGERATDAAHTFSLCTLGRDVGKLKKGDRVWVVSDGDSLTSSPTASGTQPVFGDVVKLVTPIGISAGDSIGHMGFYQLPEENGKRSRYQVHIECLSMDNKLSTFLTNPEHVGEDSPAFLKYPEGAVLCAKSAEGVMAETDCKTRAAGILTLSGVPVIKAGEEVTHYQIHPEGGWLAAANIQKVSQYALGELGFVTLDKAPKSFDLIDGIKHPDNVVKGILEQMYKAAQDETRTSHALNEYNYKRLLDRIDRNQDGHYSEEEYLQAIHNESYRDALYRIIVKHGSEWYYGKDDPLWKTYLDTLTNDAPLWKIYTETFIDKMAWMKKVLDMGPEPWHMHPVVFLEAINIKNDGVTYEQLQKIFPQALDDDLNTVVSELRGKLVTYKLDTPTRLRHFFSQIKGEVGPQMKGKTEGFQFSPDTLRSFSLYYRQHSSEAEQDGYEKSAAGRIIRRADEQAIGRKHYLRLNGNRQTNLDDGYNFRGRGLIQVTGYEKYHGFYTEYNIYWSDTPPDVVNSPEKINEMPYAIRSAIWFWLHYTVYAYDLGNGYSDVVAVTKRVNGGSMGLTERQQAYNLCEEVFL